jgi:hypothetical protein
MMMMMMMMGRMSTGLSLYSARMTDRWIQIRTGRASSDPDDVFPH